LLDLNMPELHGWKSSRRSSACARRRGDRGERNITKDMKAELTKLGQRDFIPKPYRLEEVCGRSGVCWTKDGSNAVSRLCHRPLIFRLWASARRRPSLKGQVKNELTR